MGLKVSKEDMILSANELIKDKPWSIVGIIGEYKGISSRCHMYCNVHEDSLNWENPWTPTIANIKKLFGCPKCANTYRKSESEMVLELANKTKEYDFDFHSLHGEYNGLKSEVVINCPKHGLSSEWKTPWLPTINRLMKLKSTKCKKCSGNYVPTEDEVVAIINEKLPEHITASGLIDGYKGQIKSYLKLSCEKHGNGWEWPNPWTPNIDSCFRATPNCPKCSKQYRQTKDELDESLSELNINNIAYLGFSEEFRGLKTKVYVSCKIHPDIESWQICASSLLKGAACAECLKSTTKVQRTKEEIESILHSYPEEPETLKFIGFLKGHFSGVNSKVVSKCSKHGIASTWENPQTPFAQNYLSKGSNPKCLKCAGKYSYSKNELLNELNEIYKETNLSIVDLDMIETKYNSPCYVRCEIHGNGWEWENPWKPTSFSIKTGPLTQCSKCSGKYSPSADELMESTNKIVNGRYSNLSVIGFIDEYVGIKTRMKISCSKHGNAWEWDKPWTPINYTLLNNDTNCLKCTGEYNQTDEEVIRNANKIAKSEGLNVSKVVKIDGIKKLYVSCQKHGNGWEWGNVWTPRVNNFFNGRSHCPKCHKTYEPTESEFLQEANEGALLNGYLIKGLAEDYHGHRTRLLVSCPVHGNGWEYSTPWKPGGFAFRQFDTGCPKCANNKLEVQKRTSTESSDSFTSLYYAKIIDLKTKKEYYKIGLTKNTRKRFSPGILSRDNVSVEILRKMECQLDEASILEYKIKKDFSMHHTDLSMLLTVTGGGTTECFDTNILKDITLESIALKVLPDKQSIIDECYFKDRVFNNRLD